MLQRIHDSLTLGRWVVIIILGLIAFTFIFWGIGDFGSMGTASFAAKVNGEEISRVDFENELQNRQNQLQRLYGIDLPQDVRRELRAAVIEDLMVREALQQRVEDQGYRASAERVDRAIQDTPQFQVGGVYNDEMAIAILASSGLTPAGFREQQRQTLALRDFEAGVVDSTFLTPAEFRRYIELYNQRREVAYALFDAAAFTAGVSIEDAAIEERYASSQASYQTTETVDLEYVELVLADIMAGVELSDDDVRAVYEQERTRFETVEERKASHILIAVVDDQEAPARAAADAVVARLNSGADFAAVATELSADAGSKGQGGELGWFSRGGGLAGPIEDTLFALGVGEISAPVRTEQGFHVVRLDELRAGGQQPFEAVREELAADLRTRRGEDKFFERIDELKEAAAAAYDALTPVAEEMQLPLKTLDGFPRTGDANVFAEAANGAVVQAAFGEEIVDSGRNTDVVELAQDHVVVLRVKAHHLPQTKPLAEVREQVRAELTRERAFELADVAAQAFLAELDVGGDPVTLAAKHGGEWHPATWITRSDANLPNEVLSAAFGMAKTAGAPLRETVALSTGGQAVLVLTGVEPGEPTSMTQADRDARQRQLADESARADLTGYAASVRASASVNIPDDIREPPIF